MNEVITTIYSRVVVIHCRVFSANSFTFAGAACVFIDRYVKTIEKHEPRLVSVGNSQFIL